MMQRWGSAAALLCLAALSGCATRADLMQVKQEQRDTRALVADQGVAIDGLRRRLDILRGELGDGGRGRGGSNAKDAAQRLTDLEARLAALEQGRAEGAGTTPPPPAARTPDVEEIPRPVEAPTPVPAKPQNPQEVELAKEQAALQNTRVDSDYREAMGLMGQRNCSQAVPKLRDFIRKNPKSDLADNAQYWIGNCYYNQSDYNRAIIELNEVLLKYPKADKVPAALLMLANAFADSGDKIDARLILQKLISDHPKSEEAERGRQKLQALGQ
jgi:tol-pal system protein YbgF